jgi:hypothetical protein
VEQIGKKLGEDSYDYIVNAPGTGTRSKWSSETYLDSESVRVQNQGVGPAPSLTP